MSGMMRFAVFVICAFWGAAAAAQSNGASFEVGTIQSPILIIEFDRAFAQSAYGKRASLEMESAGSEIASENRQIETELKNEELALTARRASLDPAVFRKLAEAFDEKVQNLRREQDTKARALGERQEAARRQFLVAVRPVLNEIMLDTGALMILEKRNVFVSVAAVDITDQVVMGINRLLGENADFGPAPADPEAVPETSP